MRPLVGPWALMLIFGGTVAPVVAAEREVGAHLHGHGTVNMAIEGSTVWIELEAPGSDIVGFERAAESDEEIAAVAGAMALLESPLQLFALPPAAGCSVASATVALTGPGSEEMHGKESSGTGHESGRESHTEFHAEYRLACAAPERIGTVGFTYFSRFPAAQELDVNVITPARQSRYEVGKDQPLIRLGDN